ncbi:hypothetical protein F5876DRAFT_69237 [Lentinula aff. lateritia]|uniref:Uncharacterized protein n=1 Tax=Lentinula aff. lateritia TaxID=2804960 RepID=A0ACC1TNG9_9AGAR|nr:hypothetical protein F5876DRAFT_69237 [Lentinula aff. lateritia]
MDPSVQTSYADIQATFGPLLLGGLGAAILTGMIIAQGFNYLKSNTDPSYVRCMVGVIVYGYLTLKFHLTSAYTLPSFLDILHLVTLCLGLWMWFIKMHEATVAIFIVPFAISVLPKLTRFNDFELISLSPLPPTFCSYLWYSQLLRRLSPTASLPGEYSNAVPAILAFAFRNSGAIARFVIQFISQWALTVALALSAGVDVVITIMMMVLLRQSRAKSLRRVTICVASHRRDNNIQVPTYIVLQLKRRDQFSLCSNARKWSHNIACCDYLYDTCLYFIIDKLYGNSILAVQGSTLDLNVVRFSGSHFQPSPVPTKSRFTSPRSFLHLPAQICNSMKDKRAYMISPPEKTFGIIIERSVEHDFNDIAIEQRPDSSVREGIV